MNTSNNFNPDGVIKNKIVHASGEAGGMLVGKRHSEGGIKAINKSTGQPIEMEGGEVVITRNAVSDNTKRSFNGKMMTNRQILSAINESGGGVSFANGGQVPKNVTFDCNAEYEYGGKTMCGKDLAYAMGGSLANKQLITKVILTDFDKKRYFGQYKKVFDAFNKEYSLGFVDGAYELDSSGQRDSNGNYILLVSEGISGNVEDRLSKIKGISYKEIYIDKNMLQMGGTIVCGSCDWSRNRKDGGDDMFVCHKCGTDNSKNYAKGGAVDDDFSDIISAVQTVDVMEDGGETPKDTANLIKQVDDFKRENPYNLKDKFFDSKNPSFDKIQIEYETTDGRFLKTQATTYFGLIYLLNNILDVGNVNPTYFKGRVIIGVTLSIDDEIFVINLTKDGRNSNKLFNPKTGSLYNFLVSFYFQTEDYAIEKFDWTEFIVGYPATKEEKTENTENKEVKSKIDYDKLKKYLRARINALSTELNIKSVALSIDEIGIYHREIRELITRYRQLLEQERENISFLDRLKSAYSVKWGDINKQYTPADLVSINGKKTELTEQEYLTVRTENFQSFFGNWEKAYETNNYTDVSKVINEKTKEPLAVFHGTNVLFTNWKTYETNNAHYFAKKREMANFFATSWDSRGDKAGVDSQIIKKLNPNKGEFIYRCFLDIKNPIDFSRFGIEKRPVKDYLNFLKINYNIQDFDFWSNINKGFDVKQETLVYAWQIIRAWQQFTVYVKIYTPYDGYIFYEFIPDSAKQDINDASLSFCTFDSNQVKFADAVEFNALSDDSRLKYGGLL